MSENTLLHHQLTCCSCAQ